MGTDGEEIPKGKVLSRQVLGLSRRVAALESIMILSFLMPSEHAAAQEGKKGKGHKKGRESII